MSICVILLYLLCLLEFRNVAWAETSKVFQSVRCSIWAYFNIDSLWSLSFSIPTLTANVFEFLIGINIVLYIYALWMDIWGFIQPCQQMEAVGTYKYIPSQCKTNDMMHGACSLGRTSSTPFYQSNYVGIVWTNLTKQYRNISQDVDPTFERTNVDT